MGELWSTLIKGSGDRIFPLFSSLVMSTLWFLENNNLHICSEIPTLALTCPKLLLLCLGSMWFDSSCPSKKPISKLCITKVWSKDKAWTNKMNKLLTSKRKRNGAEPGTLMCSQNISCGWVLLTTACVSLPQLLLKMRLCTYQKHKICLTKIFSEYFVHW